jgi:hypothetical protein
MDYKTFVLRNKQSEAERVKKGGTTVKEAQRRGRISVGVKAAHKSKAIHAKIDKKS